MVRFCGDAPIGSGKRNDSVDRFGACKRLFSFVVAAFSSSLPTDLSCKIEREEGAVELPSRSVPFEPSAPIGDVSEIVAMNFRKAQRKRFVAEGRRTRFIPR